MVYRTHAILDQMGKGLLGQKIDFLYVDEVQDNLLIDSKRELIYPSCV